MATYVILCNIRDGVPAWLRQLREDEWQQTNLGLISHDASYSLGLYAISGPRTLMDKIASLPEVHKLLEKGKEDVPLSVGELVPGLRVPVTATADSVVEAVFEALGLAGADCRGWRLPDEEDDDKLPNSSGRP